MAVPEAKFIQIGDCEDYTAVAALEGGDVIQLADGRAGVVVDDIAAGALGSVQVRGIAKVTKASGPIAIPGMEYFWDHSANAATYIDGGDRDFRLGLVAQDAGETDTTVYIKLNAQANYKIDLMRDEFLSVTVKTVVGSTTVEVPHIERYGASHAMIFGATAEAQKLDLLSKQSFALSSNWIVEGEFNVIDDGDAAAIDFNIGVANATHASDADSITESVFLHMDGNSTQINAESDDGTTEVAATDTTKDYTLATPVHFIMDGRDPGDVQIYVNGDLVLAATDFDITLATGPLKLLAHLEKSSDDTTADYRITKLRMWTAEN